MRALSTITQIVIFSLALTATAFGASARKPVIALIAHNAGTEPTDLLVPFGVIASAGLADVQAVALSSGPVILHPSDVTVQLPHTIATFDAAYPSGADYVIVPAIHHPEDSAIAAWLRKQRDHGATLMSICDGAKVLAYAGLLKGRSATAHWYALDNLREKFPETRWRNDRRYVFDGDVITTSGVSASVPATLALLENIAGREPVLSHASRLGISSWPATHDATRFHLSGADIRLVIGNWLAFWKKERVELSLPSNVDEASAALVMDAYSRTYRTEVTLSASEVRTRHGLILRSRGNRGDRTVNPQLLRLPLGKVLDATLQQLESEYGPRTANFVATQLEYARSSDTTSP